MCNRWGLGELDKLILIIFRVFEESPPDTPINPPSYKPAYIPTDIGAYDSNYERNPETS
jgi:hypothetical protein